MVILHLHSQWLLLSSYTSVVMTDLVQESVTFLWKTVKSWFFGMSLSWTLCGIRSLILFKYYCLRKCRDEHLDVIKIHYTLSLKLKLNSSSAFLQPTDSFCHPRCFLSRSHATSLSYSWSLSHIHISLFSCCLALAVGCPKQWEVGRKQQLGTFLMYGLFWWHAVDCLLIGREGVNTSSPAGIIGICTLWKWAFKKTSAVLW